LRAIGGAGRIRNALAQRVDVRSNLVFDRLRVFRTAGHRLLRVLELLLQHVVANGAGRFLQLASGIALVVGQ
jgi:hypothetical protein